MPRPQHGARAAVYLRMSTDRQEASIPAQREAVRKLAERDGYAIVREYADEGISGDDTERREAFLRMREDAGRGEFDAILCWDQDRFGRFDALDAGYWIKPLRDAGVRLVSVAQGVINWEDFSGRLIYTVQQEGKNQFLRDLSRNVVRGMLAKAKEGAWLGGAVPYAYRVEDKRLVQGDPEQIRVVRWLFEQYAHHGVFLGELTDRLNADGTPAPGGKLWCKTSLHKILTRPIYAGVMAWNRNREGKFHEVKGGEIAAALRVRKGGRRVNAQDDWVRVDAPHLAVVDKELFDLVQLRLTENRDRTTPGHRTRVFLLTGLVKCGHCGWPMHGHRVACRRSPYRRYICGNYNIHRNAGGCACNTVTEAALVELLAVKLTAYFGSPDVRKALRAEVRRQEEAERRDEGGPSLEARIAALDRKIAAWSEKWLDAPPNLTAVLGERIEAARKDRERLDAERREQARPKGPRPDVDAVVDGVLAELARLRENIEADPAGAKAVLREIVEKVECRFVHVPYGASRRKSVLDHGEIVIREDVLLCRPVPGGRPRGTTLHNKALLTIPFTAADLRGAA